MKKNSGGRQTEEESQLSSNSLRAGWDAMRKVCACLFITTRQPKKVVPKLRKTPGVAKAGGLVGNPDAIAIEGDDINSMDKVIDRIALIPEIIGTNSKVARWLD